MLENTIKEKLFANGILVAEGEGKDQNEVYIALYGRLGIKVADDASFDRLNVSVLKDAEAFLGKPLGEPFYRSFPESVKELSPRDQLIDRLLHYMQTYGEGDHETRHFSIIEAKMAKIPFREKVNPKTFVVLDETSALKEAMLIADHILAGRTASDADLAFLMDLICLQNYVPEQIASKQILAKILLNLRAEKGVDMALSFVDRYHAFSINDVLRVLGYDTAKENPGKPAFKKLNLSNKDRKFYAALIEHIALQCDKDEIETAVEKRKDWKGLLHHLHFAPHSSKSTLLVNSVFDDTLKSVYSEVEKLFEAGDYLGSAKALQEKKGSTALLRHLNRYLSATEAMSGTRAEILDLAVQSSNPVAAMQLALNYTMGQETDRHTIMYDYYGASRVFQDNRTIRPQVSKRNGIEIADTIRMTLQERLRKNKTDQKYYIDPQAKNVALPLWSSAQAGFGVMNTGSRVDLPAEAKVVRAFVYWEKEADLDLSGMMISRTEDPVEFSWRSGWDQSIVTFSGDVTDGVKGGAEYFDIDLKELKKQYPDHKYLIFSVNNFSGHFGSYKEFPVRAGYMLRDKVSSGEIFEPKTVESSFDLTTDGSMTVMFALDLETNQLVWINKAPEGGRIAATTPMSVFFKYIDAAKLFNAQWFFENIAGSLVDNPEDADVIVGFEKAPEDTDKTYIDLRDPNAATVFLGKIV
ncbi:MAG: hypothetical protein IKO10_03685 [Lachnospiraceae bacterium]|nr:hypothetical protein [Lachnospiraceae bacterium]